MARPENIVLSVVVPLIALASVMHIQAAYAGDKSWLLLAAKKLLSGERLSIEVIEVNPPLIVWLYAIPVFLALHLPGLQDYNALALMGLAASALSVWLALKLIRLHPYFDARQRLEFTLLLASLFVLFTPAAYFFDREHILLVLTFPYLLRFSPSLARQPLPLTLKLVIGVMAAVGFCIKPYGAILFLAALLLTWKRERSAGILFGLENLTVWALGLLYLACVLHFTPAYLTILRMAMETYSAFSRRLLGIFYAILALMMAGLAFIDYRPRHASPYRRDIAYFTGMTLAYFAYAMANNGWGYTYHPLICMILFLSGWMIWDYRWLQANAPATPSERRRFTFGTRACGANLLLTAGYSIYVLFLFFSMPACEWSSDCERNLPYVDYIDSRHIRSFGALTEDFHKWAALARTTGAAWDTRYNALWMVPGLVAQGEALAGKNRWIVDYVGEGLAQDLDRFKPPIVFVDDRKHFFGTDRDVFLPDIFIGVPAFKNAWGHYRYGTTIDNCRPPRLGDPIRPTGCRYDIYQRIAGGRP